MKSGPERSSRYLKGIDVRRTAATPPQDLSNEAFGRLVRDKIVYLAGRLIVSCCCGRSKWLDIEVKIELVAGGVCKIVVVDLFCEGCVGVREGSPDINEDNECKALFISDARAGVPRGDEPVREVCGLERQDGVGVVTASAGGEVGITGDGAGNGFERGLSQGGAKCRARFFATTSRTITALAVVYAVKRSEYLLPLVNILSYVDAALCLLVHRLECGPSPWLKQCKASGRFFCAVKPLLEDLASILQSWWLVKPQIATNGRKPDGATFLDQEMARKPFKALL
ncbi:hypothetical protein C8R45DRAFT_931572 [Mycena sanguinolenta]|nr:hypothetical protein C8R45DRAFT_931572 [Mycena sanguinolenta]